MHLKSAECNPKMFGFPVEGFIGTINQKKGFEDNWIDCFLNLRIIPQLSILKSTMQAGSKIVASGHGIPKKLKILECIPPFSKPAT